MKCEKCGTEFEGNFCPNCGTPSEAGKNICPRCGQARSGADRFCKNCGYDFHQSEKSLKTSAATAGGAAAAIKRVPKKVWIRIAIALAVVAVLLAVLIPTISHFTNKFRIGVVEQISIGDSKERVIELLGEPYNYNADSATFEYYSDNYLKLLEENDSFNPDDIEDWDDFENAFDDALALEEKLQTEEYSYIRVTFDSEDKVTSVLLDASRTEQTKNAAKEVSKAELLTDDVENFLQAYSDGSLAYYAQYTDGSYYMGFIPKNAQDISITQLLWTDNYGNRCQQEIELNLSQDWEEIQSESGEKIVYILDNYAEAPKDATSVVILGGVTSIGERAFYGCEELTSITIPDSVTSIGWSAFEICDSLANITIPDSITSIGGRAFMGCNGLTSITFGDNSQLISIGHQAFDGCSSLASISIPDTVVEIHDFAFADCSSLTSITVPDSVTSIGGGAFEGCSGLTSITIPDSVTSIGSSAFEDTAYYNDAVNWENDVLYIGNHLIKAHSTLSGTYSIRNGTKTIAASAFYYCESLTSIEIPDGVTSVGDSAFSGCSSLTSITIPDSVTSIGWSAFYYCSGLTSITIPDSVTSIGSYAFSGCSELTSITVASSNPVYHSAGNCLIETESKTLILGCKNSIIPTDGSVTSIGWGAFAGCSGLTSIAIPDSVTSIGYEAFLFCESLTSVTFEDAEGWCVPQSEGATSGTDLASSDLSNPATAAEYLTSTYWGYYWYKR